MTYMLSMYDILKLKVDVHEALTVGAGWRERQPWETEGRVASPTPFHIFSLFFLFPQLIFLLLLFIMV